MSNITRYKIGFHNHGVRITRIFDEHVTYEFNKGIWKYHPTVYYVLYDNHRGIGPKPFMLEEYQINTLLDSYRMIWRKRKLLRSKLNKMLDKKYEGYNKKKKKGHNYT